MRLNHRDIEMIASVNIADIYAYLQSHGWSERGRTQEGVTSWIYQRPDTPKRTLLLPPNSEYADFFDRVSDALEALEKIEDRPQLSILRDISRIGSDVIRIRGINPEIENGSLPLKDGINFYTYSYRILLAAACSASTPRAVHNEKPEDAVQYVDKEAKLEQAELGSYVIVVTSPAEKLQNSNSPASPNFNRTVVETLATSLQSLYFAATERVNRRDSGLQLFVDNIEQGISSNLCSAVASASSSLNNGDISVSVTWSGFASPSENTPNTIVLPNSLMPVIREAADFLSELNAERDYHVRGYVVSANTNYRGSYTVIVNESFNSSNPSIKMKLSRADYNLALEAMSTMQRIDCYGDLIKRRIPYFLQDVKKFSILG